MVGFSYFNNNKKMIVWAFMSIRTLRLKINLWLILHPFGRMVIFLLYFILLSFIINFYNVVYAETFEEKWGLTIPEYSQPLTNPKDNSILMDYLKKDLPIIKSPFKPYSIFPMPMFPYQIFPYNFYLKQFGIALPLLEKEELSLYSETNILEQIRDKWPLGSINIILEGFAVNKAFISFLEPLNATEKAVHIVNRLICDIEDHIDNYPETANDSPNLKNIITWVLHIDPTQSVWVTTLPEELKDLNNTLAHAIKYLSTRLAEEEFDIAQEKFDIAKYELLRHLRVQMYLICAAKANNKDAIFLILNDKAYEHFDKQLKHHAQ